MSKYFFKSCRLRDKVEK